MTAVVAQKSCLSPFVMRSLDFTGLMMTLSNPQDEYLNQQVILFRLQYEIHILQMYPKSWCRSVITPTPKLSKQTIRPQVSSTSLSILSQSVTAISIHLAISVVPHIFCCCPTSPLPSYPYLLSFISSAVLFHRCLSR